MESETSNGRYNLYSVHVSNVPSTATAEDLKALFRNAGDVVEIYMAPRVRTDSKFTYAFVRYKTSAEVQKACEVMNNVKIDNAKLNVALSISTRERVSGFRDNRSIVKIPLPRMEQNKYTVLASDERLLHQKLKASLNCLNSDAEVSRWIGVTSSDDIKDFMKDLKEVLVSISNVPFGVGVDPVNYGAERMQKSHIEEIIVRYHDLTETEVPFKEVDVDLSENNLLSENKMGKLFPCFTDICCHDSPDLTATDVSVP